MAGRAHRRNRARLSTLRACARPWLLGISAVAARARLVCAAAAACAVALGALWTGGQLQPRGSTELGALWRDGHLYYVGALRDGRPEGRGTLLTPTRVYSGELVGGRPHGHGQQLLVGPGGRAHYVGDFQRGERSGLGTCFWDDGAVYTGDWRFGAMHGHGTMTYASGRSWTGEWAFGARHGRGTLFDAEDRAVSHTEYAYGMPLDAGPAEVFPWPESEVVRAAHATLATPGNTSLEAPERALLFRTMGAVALHGLNKLAA